MNRSCPLLAAALAAWLLPVAAQATQVTIYRCTGADGHLTLRDTPCRAGEKQEAREMLRPQDPPVQANAPVAASAPVATPPPRETTRYVVITPPQPLYECITVDGERYTSDTGEGRGHWEPLWALGYPVVPLARPDNGGVSARVDFGGGNVHGRLRIGDPHPRPPVAIAPVVPTGTWVRDQCHPLPQQEVCDRLRDQRYELNRRWNIAQPSERAQIDRETRGIDARLANDCGGS